MASKQPLKDPKGGLTAAGRRHFKRKEGANLKAGVKGKADTPQKMRRKGSFLTRFFTNPSGPMVKPNGEPSRLALSANAWGEPVPKNRSDAARLAAKGRRLLERYENTKIEKENPHHDEIGRFTFAPEGAKSSAMPNKKSIKVVKELEPFLRKNKDGSFKKITPLLLKGNSGEDLSLEIESEGVKGGQSVSATLRLGSSQSKGLVVGRMTASNYSPFHDSSDGLLKIDEVSVHSEHMRKGYASTMMTLASKYSIGSEKIHHSNILTESGKKFAREASVSKYNPYHDELGRFSSSGNSSVVVLDKHSRIVTGKDGIPMKMGTPDAQLAQFHGIQKNWQGVRAIAESRREKIASIYESNESAVTEQAAKSWDYTEKEINKQFEILTKKVGAKVEFVDEDPYPDFFTMAKDFRENRRLKVLKTEATGGHPYWSNETNDKFRAVHDAWGHLATGRGFDRHGEEAAYRAHKSMFGEQAYACLATELRAQNAYLIQRGSFGDQKVMVLPESLQKGIVKTMVNNPKNADADAQRQSDLDNLTLLGGTRHASNGRNFAKKMSKSEPTVSDVHLPTIMNNKKKRKRTKKMMLSSVVEKHKKLKK